MIEADRFTAGNYTFWVKDSYPRHITIADSFIIRSNKIGTGNGEAKIYLGTKQKMMSFFGDDKLKAECFFLKEDLINFLDYAEKEYHDPMFMHQADKNELRDLWESRRKKVENLDEVVFFTIVDKYDLKGPRGYVKSDDESFNIIREISLPLVSYLRIMRVTESVSGKEKLYWKIFVDFDYLKNKASALVFKYGQAKNQNKKNRKGQGKYRRLLLKECPSCPITHISDESLLIASHIKPHCVSTDDEKIDPKNGFTLSPLYDKLFNDGFITFSDEKEMWVSKWLSQESQKLLKLNEIKVVNDLPLDEKRRHYLAYHRKIVFKG